MPRRAERAAPERTAMRVWWAGRVVYHCPSRLYRYASTNHWWRQYLARRRRPKPHTSPEDLHPTAPAFIDAAREMGVPILDDVNGPMVPGAGYINMNIA